jgi:aminobenzoyl-glutamate utilization protein B
MVAQPQLIQDVREAHPRQAGECPARLGERHQRAGGAGREAAVGRWDVALHPLEQRDQQRPHERAVTERIAGQFHDRLGQRAKTAHAGRRSPRKTARGIKGRVRYYGCPAEEGGAAKGFMARAGVFSDVDVAISWHPAAFSGVNEAISLANTRIDFTFHGRAAHAAAAPHLGRSALDAVELMNVGVNYMREHMPSDARVHYALLDAGGIAPNVVQARAKVRYLIRASDLPELTRLVERVHKIAEGAALMTETRMESQVVSAVSNLLANTPLEKAMYDQLVRLGPPPLKSGFIRADASGRRPHDLPDDGEKWNDNPRLREG